MQDKCGPDATTIVKKKHFEKTLKNGSNQHGYRFFGLKNTVDSRSAKKRPCEQAIFPC